MKIFDVIFRIALLAAIVFLGIQVKGVSDAIYLSADVIGTEAKPFIAEFSSGKLSVSIDSFDDSLNVGVAAMPVSISGDVDVKLNERDVLMLSPR